MSDNFRARSDVWQKSSRSGQSGCIEVRHTIAGVLIRDSKDPDGAVLRFSLREWSAFVEGVVLGEFSPVGEQ